MLSTMVSTLSVLKLMIAVPVWIAFAVPPQTVSSAISNWMKSAPAFQVPPAPFSESCHWGASVDELNSPLQHPSFIWEELHAKIFDIQCIAIHIYGEKNQNIKTYLKWIPIQNHLPLQLTVLHGSVIDDWPLHVPPFASLTSLVLCLVCCPPPHVFVQLPIVHALHWQLTKKKVFLYYFSNEMC